MRVRRQPGNHGRREEMITMMIWDGSRAWWQASLMWLAVIAFDLDEYTRLRDVIEGRVDSRTAAGSGR